MANICVYCGSSPGSDPAFSQAAKELGKHLAVKGHTLIYGAGNVGLMGVVADAVLSAGGKAIGVIPQHLVDLEVVHSDLSELHVVDSMHQRKAKMAELADCFVALPGGIGTLEEIIEVSVWSQLAIHTKACGLLNVSGFYDNLIAFLRDMVRNRLLTPEHLNQLQVGTDAADLVERLLKLEIKPFTKWLDSKGQV